MKYIFGPVSSRRFGVSLGVDLSPDEKCCNYDCLYCELKVARVVSAIKNPPKVADIISELKVAIKEFGTTDVITLTAYFGAESHNIIARHHLQIQYQT